MKYLYMAAGGLCLALAFIGVLLPGLPTTPFVLLAAFLFSRSSKRVHQWILDNKIFGKMVRDWEAHGVIRIRAKIISSVAMTGLIGFSIFFTTMPNWIKGLMVLILASVMVFIWSRPSKPNIKTRK